MRRKVWFAETAPLPIRLAGQKTEKWVVGLPDLGLVYINSQKGPRARRSLVLCRGGCASTRMSLSYETRVRKPRVCCSVYSTRASLNAAQILGKYEKFAGRSGNTKNAEKEVVYLKYSVGGLLRAAGRPKLTKMVGWEKPIWGKKVSFRPEVRVVWRKLKSRQRRDLNCIIVWPVGLTYKKVDRRDYQGAKKCPHILGYIRARKKNVRQLIFCNLVFLKIRFL